MGRFGRALNFRMKALVPNIFQGFIIEIHLCEDSLLLPVTSRGEKEGVYESEPVVCTITLNCEDRRVGWTARRSPMETVKEACKQVNCVLDEVALRQKTCQEMLPILYDTGLDPDKYFTVLGIRVDHLPPVYAVRARSVCVCVCCCISQRHRKRATAQRLSGCRMSFLVGAVKIWRKMDSMVVDMHTTVPAVVQFLKRCSYDFYDTCARCKKIATPGMFSVAYAYADSAPFF